MSKTTRRSVVGLTSPTVSNEMISIDENEQEDNHYKMFFILIDRKTKFEVSKIFWEKGEMKELIEYLTVKINPFDEFATISILQHIKHHLRFIYEIGDYRRVSSAPDLVLKSATKETMQSGEHQESYLIPFFQLFSILLNSPYEVIISQTLSFILLLFKCFEKIDLNFHLFNRERKNLILKNLSNTKLELTKFYRDQSKSKIDKKVFKIFQSYQKWSAK